MQKDRLLEIIRQNSGDGMLTCTTEELADLIVAEDKAAGDKWVARIKKMAEEHAGVSVYMVTVALQHPYGTSSVIGLSVNATSIEAAEALARKSINKEYPSSTILKLDGGLIPDAQTQPVAIRLFSEILTQSIEEVKSERTAASPNDPVGQQA